jgi:hypothetical protein
MQILTATNVDANWLLFGEGRRAATK